MEGVKAGQASQEPNMKAKESSIINETRPWHQRPWLKGSTKYSEQAVND